MESSGGNQATDRAFRIGQQRVVQVYKLLCAGTLEERIDTLIEHKQGIAGAHQRSGEPMAERSAVPRNG